jgi:hypothetical protein
MVQYNKRELLETILKENKQLSLDFSEELLQMGHLLGSQRNLLREVYKTFRTQHTEYKTKPMIGAPFLFQINWEEQTVYFERMEVKLEFPLQNFLSFMGLVDAIYSDILPLGSVVELDVEMMPSVLQQMFKENNVGELVLLTGRKLPLRDGFDQYIVDYIGNLWPFGQTVTTPPIFITNIMIKRIVHQGLTNESEEEFAYAGLRAFQLANHQISTAFMSVEDSLNFYKETHPESEDV